MSARVFDLGSRQNGELVEISLSGTAANVRLVDSSNLSKLKRGQKHSYHGGHYTSSPVRLPIPRNGRWHVVVDHGGLKGRTRASVRILPGALPAGGTLSPARAHPQLSDIADNIAELVEHPDNGVIDVFISHASEDKDDVARPLANALRGHGLEVWYDEYQLRIGDSLRRKIDDGLRRSRFGIVILSEAFFRKGWPQYELDGLVMLSVTGKQVLLPIWHGVDHDAVTGHSPSLGDKVALRTADAGVADIAEQIAEVVRDHDW